MGFHTSLTLFKFMNIHTHEMSFSGEVLERGFWLYVWKIEFNGRLFFYVGRTGDSSSSHASSPFNRISQHLDFRSNAKGNSLARHLKHAGIEPKRSKFNMLALGPFFAEQEDFEKHKPLRDYMATLEVEVAKWLRKHGLTVIGIHHQGCEVPIEIVENVMKKVNQFIGNSI